MLRVLLFVMLSCPFGIGAQMADGFEDAQTTPQTPDEPECEVPAGFTVHEKAWEDIFYGASWPNSPSYLVPIGSWSHRDNYAPYGKPAAGRLLTAKFVADANMHKLSFLGAQPIAAAGYPLAQGAYTTTVTMSRCRADMYAPCQATARSGVLYYGANATAPECRTKLGETYWITWHHAPADFSPQGNTCNSENPSKGARCDANFSAR